MAAGNARTLEVLVAEGPGGRLDKFIADRLDLSRTHVVRLIQEGCVTVNGVDSNKSHQVEAGERVQVEVPTAVPLDAVPEDIPIDIVYQDPDVVVVNKQPGLVVHPARGHPNGTLVNALLHHVRDLSGIGGALRPGIVHRLDKDTSGLMVVAKSDRAHRTLSDDLKARKVRRVYRAVCWGHLQESLLTVDAPIARHPRDRLRMAVVEGGREARSSFRLRERWTSAEYLDVALHTGRTHQIRVHLAHIGHPVVGDTRYGAGWERGMGGGGRHWARELARRVPRQFLHAAELRFTHPVSGKELEFESELPEDLQQVLLWCRDDEVGIT